MPSSEPTAPAPDPRTILPAWAHASGILCLGTGKQPADPQALLDRLPICECIARYCWSYDERRADCLRACFAEDAVWEGNVLGQIRIGPFQGRECIVNWLQDFWPHQRDQRRHMLLNTIVEEQSQTGAVTLSYLLLLGSDGKRVSVETSGFYRVSYVRHGQHWLIQHLLAGFDAPFWPGELKTMSPAGRARHGVSSSA